MEQASRRRERSRAMDAVMSKEAAAMPFMEDAATRCGQSIGWIDFGFQDQVAGMAPFLDCTPLNVDMTSAFGGLAVIYNVDGGLVVFKNNSWSRRGKA
jgi:hypothetical protein